MSLADMLSGTRYHQNFINGTWITIYLSPQDYHRIHSPVSGDIVGYSYCPGRLFPVNHFAVSMVKNLFSKNERLITYIQTKQGMIALVKVGATVVGEIKVTYDNRVASNKWVRKSQDQYYNEPIPIQKGDELGRFEMGSTVILLFEGNNFNLLDFEPKDRILFGQPIALFNKMEDATLPKAKKRTSTRTTIKKEVKPNEINDSE